MEKKTVIISVVALAAFAFGIVKFKDYYDNRYVENDNYYVRIADDQSTEIEDLIDDSGKVMDKGKSYKLEGINKEGLTRILEFSYQTEDPNKLLQPGQYLKVSVSPTIVLGQEVISESEVPQEILSKLK